MNEDMKALHTLLGAQHRALFRKLGATSDPELAKQILLEMRELLHRIDVAQNLLFKEQTQALTKAMAGVASADQELTKAIKQAERAADILKGVSKFLAVVDKVLDVAKLAAGVI
jgi:hypothetical protein